jgi:hypothetical protein
MVRQEEIAAAKVAKVAIGTLAVSAASRQATIRTLRKANRIATLAIARLVAQYCFFVFAAAPAASEMIRSAATPAIAPRRAPQCRQTLNPTTGRGD